MRQGNRPMDKDVLNSADSVKPTPGKHNGWDGLSEALRGQGTVNRELVENLVAAYEFGHWRPTDKTRNANDLSDMTLQGGFFRSPEHFVGPIETGEDITAQTRRFWARLANEVLFQAQRAMIKDEEAMAALQALLTSGRITKLRPDYAISDHSQNLYMEINSSFTGRGESAALNTANEIHRELTRLREKIQQEMRKRIQTILNTDLKQIINTILVQEGIDEGIPFEQEVARVERLRAATESPEEQLKFLKLQKDKLEALGYPHIDIELLPSEAAYMGYQGLYRRASGGKNATVLIPMTDYRTGQRLEPSEVDEILAHEVGHHLMVQVGIEAHQPCHGVAHDSLNALVLQQLRNEVKLEILHGGNIQVTRVNRTSRNEGGGGENNDTSDQIEELLRTMRSNQEKAEREAGEAHEKALREIQQKLERIKTLRRTVDQPTKQISRMKKAIQFAGDIEKARGDEDFQWWEREITSEHTLNHTVALFVQNTIGLASQDQKRQIEIMIQELREAQAIARSMQHPEATENTLSEMKDLIKGAGARQKDMLKNELRKLYEAMESVLRREERQQRSTDQLRDENDPQITEAWAATLSWMTQQIERTERRTLNLIKDAKRVQSSIHEALYPDQDHRAFDKSEKVGRQLVEIRQESQKKIHKLKTRLEKEFTEMKASQEEQRQAEQIAEALAEKLAEMGQETDPEALKRVIQKELARREEKEDGFAELADIGLKITVGGMSVVGCGYAVIDGMVRLSQWLIQNL